MACCLTAPSHYLNQCWLISKVLRHSPERNFAGNAPDVDHWYDFENDWFEITAIFPRDQWVKLPSAPVHWPQFLPLELLSAYLLPWIFPGAPLAVDGAPGNIQGNGAPGNIQGNSTFLQCNTILLIALNDKAISYCALRHQYIILGRVMGCGLWSVRVSEGIDRAITRSRCNWRYHNAVPYAETLKLSKLNIGLTCSWNTLFMTHPNIRAIWRLCTVSKTPRSS